jgi:hypothetical protein
MRTLYRRVLALALLSSVLPTIGVGGSGEPGNSAQQPCQAAIIGFLQAPTAASLAKIGHGSADLCRSSLKTEQLQALDKLVATGNSAAAALLAPHIRRLDGGELEDSLRAFGQFATHRMRDFMALAANGALTEREATDALTMLPLELEDNCGAQIAELKSRRSALEGVSGPQVQDRKKTAIAAIDAFIAEIDRARSSFESQTR